MEKTVMRGVSDSLEITGAVHHAGARWRRKAPLRSSFFFTCWQPSFKCICGEAVNRYKPVTMTFKYTKKIASRRTRKKSTMGSGTR